MAQAPVDAPTIIGQIVYQKSGLQEAEKKNLQGYFSYKLRSVAGTHRILNAGFFQKNAAFTRCDNGPCMAAMGKQLKANQVIQTRLTRRGKKCVVQCTVFNVDKKKSERTVEEVGDCSQENLFILVENAVIRVARFNNAAFATERGDTFPDDMDDEDEDQVPLAGETADDKADERRAKEMKKSIALATKAKALLLKGKKRAAFKTAQQALSVLPGNIPAINTFGTAACKLKRAKNALWAYGKLPRSYKAGLRAECQRHGIKLAPAKKGKPAKK